MSSSSYKTLLHKNIVFTIPYIVRKCRFAGMMENGKSREGRLAAMRALSTLVLLSTFEINHAFLVTEGVLNPAELTTEDIKKKSVNFQSEGKMRTCVQHEEAGIVRKRSMFVKDDEKYELLRMESDCEELKKQIAAGKRLCFDIELVEHAEEHQEEPRVKYEGESGASESDEEEYSEEDKYKRRRAKSVITDRLARLEKKFQSKNKEGGEDAHEHSPTEDFICSNSNLILLRKKVHPIKEPREADTSVSTSKGNKSTEKEVEKKIITVEEIFSDTTLKEKAEKKTESDNEMPSLDESSMDETTDDDSDLDIEIAMARGNKARMLREKNPENDKESLERIAGISLRLQRSYPDLSNYTKEGEAKVKNTVQNYDREEAREEVAYRNDYGKNGGRPETPFGTPSMIMISSANITIPLNKECLACHKHMKQDLSKDHRPLSLLDEVQKYLYREDVVTPEHVNFKNIDWLMARSQDAEHPDFFINIENQKEYEWKEPFTKTTIKQLKTQWRSFKKAKWNEKRQIHESFTALTAMVSNNEEIVSDVYLSFFPNNMVKVKITQYDEKVRKSTTDLWMIQGETGAFSLISPA